MVKWLGWGWTIKMVCQPTRPPMRNRLDLGVFNCIQSVQYRQPTNQMDDLIHALQTAFNSIQYQIIEKMFPYFTKSDGMHYLWLGSLHLQTPSCAQASRRSWRFSNFSYHHKHDCRYCFRPGSQLGICGLGLPTRHPPQLRLLVLGGLK